MDLKRIDKVPRLIIKGATGTGKTALLQERYRYLVDERRVQSDRILVLVSNAAKLDSWNTSLLTGASSKQWCRTFYGFVKEELTLYYPIAVEGCPSIFRKEIKPAFLSQEEAGFLVSKAVQARREREGSFAALVSSNEKIAADIVDNLAKATSSGIPHDMIGSRLFGSLELKDEVKHNLFREVDSIIQAYRNKCLELGVLDAGMAIELYNSCLLQNPVYAGQLAGRVMHLMVDDLQMCTRIETDTIELIMKSAESCMISYNPEFDHSMLKPEFDSGVLERLECVCGIRELDKPAAAKSFLYEFSEMLFDNISRQVNKTLPEKLDKPVIERNPTVELRSEMLEKLGERICTLIEKDGYKQNEIIILSTYADIVTELVISGILEKNGYKLKNIGRRERAVSNRLCRSLLTFAQLCHPDFRIFPTFDDIKTLVEVLFMLDPVRASRLGRKIYSAVPFPRLPGQDWEHLTEILQADPGADLKLKSYENNESRFKSYEYVLEWMEYYREKSETLPIGGFLQKAFLEIFISDEYGMEDINSARQLIDNAGEYYETALRFNRNAGRDFIEMSRNILKSRHFKAADGRSEEQQVLLMTPAVFLNNPFYCKVLVLCSISSENWSPRCIGEITNSYVLSSDWMPEMLFTEELEDNYRRQYLASLMRVLLKKCQEKLITFESLYSANGFENTGVLSEYLNEIM